MIRANAAALGVPNLKLVEGAAPAALSGLAPPDAVFIGGGVSISGLLDLAWTALQPGGRLVANAVTAEGEAVILAAQARLGGEASRINVARLEPVGPYRGWKPLMPVTQWWVRKS